MKVLGIECATSACSAALLCDGEVIACEYEEMDRGHSQFLVPMIENVLENAGCKAIQLDAIVATVGPGTYTGVRVGLSTAQALAMATSKPLVGVTTFEVVALAQGPQYSKMLVVLETKRADVYAQLFDPSGQTIGAPAAMDENEIISEFSLENLVVAGDAGDRILSILNLAGIPARSTNGPIRPNAYWVAKLGATRFAVGIQNDVQPLYLRPPDVGPPRKGRS